VPAYLVDSAADIRAEWLAGAHTVGVSAGASAPEVLVNQVIDSLRAFGAAEVNTLDAEPENVSFPLPSGLSL
jgi:4-hydroxy-3-methylbut-2-enyl diphosphate reductase